MIQTTPAALPARTEDTRQYTTLRDMVSDPPRYSDGVYRFRDEFRDDQVLVFMSNVDSDPSDWFDFPQTPYMILFFDDGDMETLDPESWRGDTEVYFDPEAQIRMSVVFGDGDRLNG